MSRRVVYHVLLVSHCIASRLFSCRVMSCPLDCANKSPRLFFSGVRLQIPLLQTDDGAVRPATQNTVAKQHSEVETANTENPATENTRPQETPKWQPSKGKRHCAGFPYSALGWLVVMALKWVFRGGCRRSGVAVVSLRLRAYVLHFASASSHWCKSV